MRDVEWLQIWCRPVEANVNVCRQTRLRWADRREMASTCCRAGPSTPLHLYVCVCVHHVGYRVILVPCSKRPAEGLTPPCPWIFDPVFQSLTSERSSAHLSPYFEHHPFSLAEMCFSTASPSLSVGVRSLLILLVSLRLSFNLHKSGAVLPARGKDSHS